jgi:hypothetical protein
MVAAELGGGFWREKHFRLGNDRGYGLTEERSVGLPLARISGSTPYLNSYPVTSAATALATILERALVPLRAPRSESGETHLRRRRFGVPAARWLAGD